jgi:hypothetical protein
MKNAIFVILILVAAGIFYKRGDAAFPNLSFTQKLFEGIDLVYNDLIVKKQEPGTTPIKPAYTNEVKPNEDMYNPSGDVSSFTASLRPSRGLFSKSVQGIN